MLDDEIFLVRFKRTIFLLLFLHHLIKLSNLSPFWSSPNANISKSIVFNKFGVNSVYIISLSISLISLRSSIFCSVLYKIFEFGLNFVT